MYNLIIPWIITIFVEFIIIWLFIRREPAKLLFYSLLINSITLPLATYSYLYIFPNLILTEAGVILAETVLLKLILNISYRQSLIISAVANITSAMLGIIILSPI